MNIHRFSIRSLVVAGCLSPVFAQAPDGPRPAPPGGEGRFPMMLPKMELSAKFDEDGNGIVEGGERKAVLEFLAKERAGRPQRGPGGRGPGGPPGGGGQGRGFGGPGRGNHPPAEPGKAVTQGDIDAYPGEPLYDPDTLRTVFLEFDSAAWETEMASLKGTDVEMPAKLTVDGKDFGMAGVRFRGASSFMMVPQGHKRSLNLSIDFTAKDTQLGGYRTLNLMNAAGDPGFLSAPLYSHIARKYIPAPRANYMRVVLQGENWGVYVNQQQFNKDFLRDFFPSTQGRRWHVPGSPRGRGSLAYLGDDMEPYREIYELKTNETPEAWKDLIQLTKVLDETDPSALETALEPLLDIDGVLEFLALENVLMNSDGYWTRTSDYSLYQDPSGKFHVIPHDMNESFRASRGPGGRGGFGGPGGEARPESPAGNGGGYNLDPLIAAEDTGKPLISKLLAVPSLRQRYLEHVREIAETWLDWQNLGPLAESFQKVIHDDVRSDTKKLATYEAFVSAREDLKKFADGRRDYLLNHPAIKDLTKKAE